MKRERGQKPCSHVSVEFSPAQAAFASSLVIGAFKAAEVVARDGWH
jgi:hypothetical protein